MSIFRHLFVRKKTPSAHADIRSDLHQRSPVRAAENATEIDLALMQRALEHAKLARDMAEVPVGAVVYVTETAQIIAQAHNRRECDNDPCAHAELLAIRQAAKHIGDWRLNHCTLIVTLEPCAMCAGTIVNARVGRVIYGADDPKAGACRSVFSITANTKLNHVPIVIGGVYADESSALLKEFFRERRARKRGK